MTRILVSVRTLDEARVARDGGADLIDIKEPARGSLGAADRETVRAIVDGLGPGVPVSVALGELLAPELELAPEDAEGVAYAKLGLAGCGSRDDWPTCWEQRMGRCPRGVAAVAVVYADAAANGPTANRVLEAAVACRAAAVLVDTYDKSGGGLLTHWSMHEVAHFVDAARTSGLLVALAGSLDLTAVRTLLPLEPDYLAVRGAVCRGGRLGPLDPQRVRRLVALVRAGPERPRKQLSGTYRP